MFRIYLAAAVASDDAQWRQTVKLAISKWISNWPRSKLTFARPHHTTLRFSIAIPLINKNCSGRLYFLNKQTRTAADNVVSNNFCNFNHHDEIVYYWTDRENMLFYFAVPKRMSSLTQQIGPHSSCLRADPAKRADFFLLVVIGNCAILSESCLVIQVKQEKFNVNRKPLRGINLRNWIFKCAEPSFWFGHTL